MSHRLGIDTFIEEISILKEINIPVKLRIFGGGEDRSDIVKIIEEQNLERNIKSPMVL